jgi:hypothetical protein
MLFLIKFLIIIHLGGGVTVLFFAGKLILIKNLWPVFKEALKEITYLKFFKILYLIYNLYMFFLNKSSTYLTETQTEKNNI